MTHDENKPSPPPESVSENRPVVAKHTITPQHNPQINALINILNPVGHYQQPSNLPTGTLPTNPYWRNLDQATVDAAKANQLQQQDYENIAANASEYILSLVKLLEDARKKLASEEKSLSPDVADMESQLENAAMDGRIVNGVKQRELELRGRIVEAEVLVQELKNTSEWYKKWVKELGTKTNNLRDFEACLNSFVEAQIERHASNEGHSKGSEHFSQEKSSTSLREEGTMQDEDRYDGDRTTGFGKRMTPTSSIPLMDQHEELNPASKAAESIGRTVVDAGSTAELSTKDDTYADMDGADETDSKNNRDTYTPGGIAGSDWGDYHLPHAEFSPYSFETYGGRTLGHKQQQTLNADFIDKLEKDSAKRKAEMKRMVRKHGNGNTSFDEELNGRNSSSSNIEGDQSANGALPTSKTGEEQKADGEAKGRADMSTGKVIEME